MSTSLKIIQLDSVESTNSYAWDLAQKGEGEITIVKANAQTQGRGRMGRSWDSPKGVGIYASFILRPSNPLKEIQRLPVIFALGVAKTLRSLVNTRIKEPNDVMVNGRKISGILVETKGNKTGVDFVVVGVGININNEQKDLITSATSLYLETKKKYNIDALFKEIITQELTLYEQFRQGRLGLIQKELRIYKK
ncbi:MAG: biotin--[acetyl-CoA-carboxylase] ligase [Candidatus Omnitrophota bacterium]|nr:MAG: biotin--[acetyl-CoA-carboxylase] ligase [Candidatus Omnitrophota bacterium]